MIHNTAIIESSAELDPTVEVGPWTYIGKDVKIGAGTVIGPHVVIKGPTTIGKNNHIYQYSSVGEDPQDKKYHGEISYLEIGDNNIIREFTTLNRGTENGGGLTKIGNNNLLMAYVHVAHDCIVGNNTIFANNASLAGHVTVEDYVILSGFSAVHQFVFVGAHSFVGHATMVSKDVLPYLLVLGDPAEPHGLNSVGLRRREFSSETLSALKNAYKIIYRQGLMVTEAIEQLKALVTEHKEVQLMLDGLERSQRGIAR